MSVKTFRNLNSRPKILGIEAQDWIYFAAAAGVLFAASRLVSFNIAVLTGFWLWLFLIKARKAPGYTSAAIQYWLASKRLMCRLEPSFGERD